MTLTRTPCELDKMSLFQDLKLKRRKVDSRCSSDGKRELPFNRHIDFFNSLVTQIFSDPYQNLGTIKMNVFANSELIEDFIRLYHHPPTKKNDFLNMFH